MLVTMHDDIRDFHIITEDIYNVKFSLVYESIRTWKRIGYAVKFTCGETSEIMKFKDKEKATQAYQYLNSNMPYKGEKKHIKTIIF